MSILHLQIMRQWPTPSLGVSSVSFYILCLNSPHDASPADTITGTQYIISEVDCPPPITFFLVPSQEMYNYGMLASLGDDVYEEPSTQRLERHVAQLLGKEAALFVPSGSMSNQIALRAHLTQPPHSVLCDIRSHINW